MSACPTGAIQVEIVKVDEWRATAAVATPESGLPSSDQSLSTTRITLPKTLPPNARPTDLTHLTVAEPHWPLIVMSERRAQAHDGPLSGKRGGLMPDIKRLLGLDTHAEHDTYCSVGCGMFIGVKDGRAVSVRGNLDHPVDTGALCPKGLSGHDMLHASSRARHPMLRRARGLERVRWDEAIETMARRFGETQQQHGPESVGVISTGQLVTEEFYTLGKLVQLGLGTRNYDGNSTLCMSTAVAGYKPHLRSDDQGISSWTSLVLSRPPITGTMPLMQRPEQAPMDWTGVQPDQSPIEPLDSHSFTARLRLLSERARSLTILRKAFEEQQSHGK